MKCLILFSGKNKKNISFSSAEFTKRMVKVKHMLCHSHVHLTPFCQLSLLAMLRYRTNDFFLRRKLSHTYTNRNTLNYLPNIV